MPIIKTITRQRAPQNNIIFLITKTNRLVCMIRLKMTQEKHIADGYLVKYDTYCNYFKTPIRREYVQTKIIR